MDIYVIILGTVMEKNKNCGWLPPCRKNLGRNDFHPCSFEMDGTKD